MAKSKYQKYDTELINRKDIKNAPYNPRIIDKEAEKRLRAEIRRNGLVAAPVWNKRTGNIVGGHQRIKQLDALEKSKDYDLTVCVIDVDEREEARINIDLNNPSIQGDWDIDKLADLTKQFDIDLAQDTSFTKMDVDFLFDGDDAFSEMFEPEERVETEEQIEKVKEARSKGREKMNERGGINFYVTIVFEDDKKRAAFMRDINLPIYEEFITEDQVRRLEKKKGK